MCLRGVVGNRMIGCIIRKEIGDFVKSNDIDQLEYEFDRRVAHDRFKVFVISSITAFY